MKAATVALSQHLQEIARDLDTAIEGEQMLVSSMLRAFADMLEAQEKAVLVAWWNKRTGQILRPHELDAIPDAPHPHSYFKNGFVPLTAHFAQAQPPAASVPTMRFFIGGPRACAYVDKDEHVEAVITALCDCTGDDRDDYTSTDLLASERVR